jgi:chorismate dehydratase
MRPYSSGLTQRRMAKTARIRLGVIDYLNVLPVYDAVIRQAEAKDGLPGIDLVAGVPARMNRALEAGEVDCSNVSSVAFGAHAREWLLVPHLSVAAHGRVESVVLFSWHADWRALDGASIALCDHSATSGELMRLLCERRLGIHPSYVTRPPELDAMLAEHEAALLIGDIALREHTWRRPIAGRGRPFVFDLAAEWQAWMDLPMVFSVWAVRADRAEAVRARGIIALLRESKACGLAELDRLAAEASRRLELPVDVCARYLRLLDYDLSERDLAGLRAFLEMAVPGFRWSDVRLLEE